MTGSVPPPGTSDETASVGSEYARGHVLGGRYQIGPHVGFIWELPVLAYIVSSPRNIGRDRMSRRDILSLVNPQV